jgi:hypothetical protein
VSFASHFSRARVLNLGHQPLKSQSNIRISAFVPTFPNLRLGSIKSSSSCYADRLIVMLSSFDVVTSNVLTRPKRFRTARPTFQSAFGSRFQRFLAKIMYSHGRSHTLEKCFESHVANKNCAVFVRHTVRKPVWRAKKSHFQASVEVGMKNVDKNIDKRNKQ